MEEKLEIGDFIGRGRFCEVFEANLGPKICVVKRIRSGVKDIGVNIGLLRESIALKKCNHPRVVGFFGHALENGKLHLILEKCKSDLWTVIQACQLSVEQIRSYSRMILEGLQCLSANGIIHRDLKPDNCLIAMDHSLKLGDFGNARILTGDNEKDQYTVQSVSRMYRPPELIMASSQYSFAVDMWSFGCIFLEMFLGQPLFADGGDMNLLIQIASLIGNVNSKTCSSLTKLPGYYEISSKNDDLFEKVKDILPSDALDFVLQVLQYEPTKRLTPSDALKHSFFSHNDIPLIVMPTTNSSFSHNGIRQTLSRQNARILPTPGSGRLFFSPSSNKRLKKSSIFNSLEFEEFEEVTPLKMKDNVVSPVVDDDVVLLDIV